jgi:hypothetical protein
VEVSVRALVEGRDAERGSYEASLCELAVAQARMADAGNTHASVALRNTLELLDELFDLRPPKDLEWFTLVDIVLAVGREGIDPTSMVGRALLASGREVLLTRHPPPSWPPGWKGTAVDGDPVEYAQRRGVDYSQPREPLQWWPNRPCPHCGGDPEQPE